MTRLFEEHDRSIQDIVAQHSGLTKDELPVIASIPGRDCWFLLSTVRLFVWSRNEFANVNIDDIADVSPAEFGIARKEDMTTLTITTRDGRQHQLKIEAGPPFFGIWNIFRNIVVNNRE